MGFDNIWDQNGLGIAITGMTIVFCALTFISVFIYLLPGILRQLAFVFPPETEPSKSTGAATNDAEVAAALGVVMHQIERHKDRPQ